MAPDGDVFGDGEVREQRKVLIDHLNAAAGRLDGIEMGIFTPFDDDASARLRPLDAGNDLDQGRFARTVFADEAMHFANFKRHVDVAQRMDAAKALGNGMQIEEVRQAGQPLRSRNNLSGVWQGPSDERRALKNHSLLRSAL